MAHEAQPITVQALPEAARLADEVNATGKARLVRFGGTVVRLAPAHPRRARAGKQPTPETVQAALAAAGGWKGLVDPDAFKRQRRELQVDDASIRAL